MNKKQYKLKVFVVKIKANPTDFCSSDLIESIGDGLENVGNYNYKDLEVTEINMGG